MTLKEFKQKILAQSSDFDDMEVILLTAHSKNREFDNYSFMGWVKTLDGATNAFAIGGLTEIQRMVEKGEMAAPQGYVPRQNVDNQSDITAN